MALIHSVSSEKLLRAIAQRADALGLVQDILLEINLAGEASKSGFAPPGRLLRRPAGRRPGGRAAARADVHPPAGRPAGGQSPIFSKITPVSC